MLLKNIRLLLAAVLMSHVATPVFAQENNADTSDSASERHAHEEAFAHSFAQTVLAIIQDTKKSYADRKDILRNAFAKSVDIDWIAKFVLGKAWGNASDDEKTRYTALYRKFLTETYVSNFAENPDRRIRDIKIFGVNDSDGDDSHFTVRTLMMLADMENLKVNYLVKEQDGKYRVRDIAIENVSLIATHRSEFSAIAASKGITGVMTELEQRLKHPNQSVAMN